MCHVCCGLQCSAPVSYTHLSQAPFHQLDHHGDQQHQNDINQCHYKIRHHKFVRIGADVVKCNVQVGGADKADEMCIRDRNADAAIYHRATGLETLFGYLYLKGEIDRIRALFTAAGE